MPSVRAQVAPIVDSSVAARVDIVANRAVDVRVRYGPDNLYGHETPRIPVRWGEMLSTTIIGLEPGAVTHLEVLARSSDGTLRSTNDITLATKPLDTGFPRSFDIAIDRPTSHGYVLLAMNDHLADRGLAVLVDRQGRVLWYRWSKAGQYAFDRLPNGRFIQHDLGLALFDEIGLDGAVARTWRDPHSSLGTDGHDFQLLPNGHALLLAPEVHQVDTRRLFRGGIEHALRMDNAVSEIAPDGTVSWRWSSFSQVSESEFIDDPAEPIDPTDYESVHLNAIEPLNDGNLLLSFRNTSTIAKIDRVTGRIVWRLGGKLSDFRFVNDPLGGFSRQHDARVLTNGHILLLDNGNLHRPPETRAVEYDLDEKAKTATLVWQYRRSPALFARIGGSARRLPDGNTLISYGPNGVVLEVDGSSNPVWELRTRHFGVYRAIAVPTLYP